MAQCRQNERSRIQNLRKERKLFNNHSRQSGSLAKQRGRVRLGIVDTDGELFNASPGNVSRILIVISERIW